MSESMFIGRKKDLASLKWLFEKKTASLVTLKGRRRIGKSTLVEHFARDVTFIRLVGIAPNAKTTAQGQRDQFAEQLAAETKSLYVTAPSWEILFRLLAERVAHGRHVILFDEISWMGSKDHMFLGQLKNAWDHYFSHNPKLILILCGSVSTWIEKEIISSTLFLGRPALNLHLKELPLHEANFFWQSKHVSALEKFKLLSVTGGVPRYLELLNTHKSAEENIAELFFNPSSVLANEFRHIFSDIFGVRSEGYKKIIGTLANGRKTQQEILSIIKRPASSEVSEYLNDLTEAGFIQRDYAWNLKTTKTSKLSTYRIKDNYLRFYLKCIEPNQKNIQAGLFENRSLASIKAWPVILGLQFECLVQNNLLLLIKKLNINLEDVAQAGPYFQRATKLQQGCQIDIMIQTRFNTLFVCEIKFHKNILDSSVIDEVEEKIYRLKKPRGFSCFPVLIHLNGVSSEVEASEYFSSVIDFGELLEG